MKIYKILATLLLLPSLYACQSELPQNNISHAPEENEVPIKISVKATVPGSNGTRAQITYGNLNINEETFMWDKKDWITLFNITRLDDCPFGVALEEVSISEDKRTAEFESYTSVIVDEGSKFEVKAGDCLLAVYGEINRVAHMNPDSTIYYDDRNIITMGLGSEANKPQKIVDTTDLLASADYMNSTLEYMKDNLKMFAITTVEQDGVVPDLHFNHLSAIMRVTIQNETGEDIYPTKLEFDYPGTKSFFNTTLYFSVNGTTNDVSSLEFYTTDDLYKGSAPFTDDIGTTINAKEGTADVGGVIPKGNSYDLYLTTVPKTKDGIAGKDGLAIHLIKNHITKTPYSITINNFDKVIEAGKRYWFKLTATPEGTLMLTSEWDKLQQQQNSSSEESN